MKKFILFILGLVIVAGLVRVSFKLPAVQDFALDRTAGVFVQRAATPLPESESLRVYVCGSASPLGATDQAQACIAVLTPDHFYVVDSGAGSTNNLSGGNLPMDRLQGVFLTHFHSDHIAELYEVNLSSWVQVARCRLKGMALVVLMKSQTQ